MRASLIWSLAVLVTFSFSVAVALDPNITESTRDLAMVCLTLFAGIAYWFAMRARGRE